MSLRKLIFSLIFSWTVLTAQNETLFRYGIDEDALQGAPDFSFLNHPLGPADRVFVKNGHFYTVGPDLQPNTDDDQQIRFFGANLTFGANFPDQNDAARVARRLRRLGVNLVRLHHMDSRQDPASRPSDANGILLDGPYPSFNPVSVQRLRDFLTALAAEGIYANLNIHVGYLFRPAVDQVPALPGMAMPTQSKPLHIFHPRMVQLQQQYAEGLIDKLQLQNDPVLAMVELNNESSVMQAWQWGQLDPVLAGDYRTALQTQWNQWLAAKYRNTDALTAAWGKSSPDGPEILSGQYVLEQGHGKAGTLTMMQTSGIPTAQVQPGAGSGWLFLKQVGFQVKAGKRYAWRFEARADTTANQNVNVPISAMRDVSPWDGFLHSSIQLTSQWQTFTIDVKPTFDINDSGRVSLDVEFSPGNVYVRNMSLVESGERGLASGESVEAGNISLLGPGEGTTASRLADYTGFLTSVDANYVTALRDSVRGKTDALLPITGTQIGYGGLSLYDSQDGLDYQDNHFYIDHYAFPGNPWDSQNWRIHDLAAAGDTWSALVSMAWGREAGRPYTVSEFNQPWPNTHGAELDPTLAAFAAFQDWDALIHFDYADNRAWDDGVPSAFNIRGDWTKYPVIGQSAWIFRTGAVKASQEPVSVPVSAAQRNLAASAGISPESWVASQARVPKEISLTRGVQLVKDGADPVTDGATQAMQAPYTSDTGELTFDKNAKLFLLNAAQAAGVIGAIGKSKVTAGPIDVELGASARGFATVLLTALDGASAGSSANLLLSLPGYSLRALPAPGNRAPDAATATPQKLINYPGTTDYKTIESTNSANPSRPSGDMQRGWRPIFMERVEAYITLRTSASSIVVSALDGAGQSAGTLPDSEVQAVPGGFRIHLNGEGQPQSVWFAIAANQP